VTSQQFTPGPAQLIVVPVSGLPEIVAGADLATLIADAALAGPGLLEGDIIVITSKIVSKAEDRVISGNREDAIRAETVRVVARRGPTTISQTRHGLVMAAAGVDESNTEPGTLVLLPVDPDASAQRLRKAIGERAGVRLGVIITDTMGRPWRAGQTDAAIGAAGITPLLDHRGQTDTFGSLLEVTVAAVADEIAAAADLIKQKTTGVPVAIVRGLTELVTDAAGPGASAIIRPAAEDMFRLGAADVLTARRTVREFTSAPVSPDAVQRSIAAAITAPAPHHSQPWRFAVLESAHARARLLDDMLAAWQADLSADGFTAEQITKRIRRGEPLRKAPLIIVPCLAADAAHTYPDARRNASERTMFVVAMGAAIENLLVALAVEGLGSCWLSSTLFCREIAIQSLGLPAAWEPMGAIGVGHPAAPAPDRLDRDPEEFVVHL
jgi:coenzyme F420-0:L-glutamate ligase / coenzyme F420-1:gamma-L-glutamate ligase